MDRHHRIKSTRVIYIILLMLISTPYISQGVQSSRLNIHKFPSPGPIRDQVRFWEAIFGKYTQQEAVIHDVNMPHIIIDVVNFDIFMKKHNRKTPYTRKEKNKLTKKYIKRYTLAIQRIQQEGKKAIQRGAMEKRVYNVYRRDRRGYLALLKGKARLRSQTGLKDEFERAAKRAQNYLPYMERIFRKHRLPTDLTRMVFVESMFNLNAYSKVGASGIWQFMPRTGRRFMTVNKWIDERNSPLKATEAAAKLLKANYEALRTWPLAITAYNHGVAGLQTAKRRLGTSNFGVIVQRHKSRTFGFASRNFYGEFLAARNIYNRQFVKKFPKKYNPLGISKVVITQPTTLRQIMRRTSITKNMIQTHNPEIKNRTYTRYLNRNLPKDFLLFVPTKYTYNFKKMAQSQSRKRKI